ncbi:unnamed protein product [Lupinus luteus]|uniref:Uncharacterized protein n=1 Tax=Lupinus luteus TaxID=3873 RepID=A0AAV1WPE9_LUPLU
MLKALSHKLLLLGLRKIIPWHLPSLYFTFMIVPLRVVNGEVEVDCGTYELAHFRPVNSGVNDFSCNGDFEISMTFPSDGPNLLVVSQTVSIALCVSPKSFVPIDSPRVVPVSDNDMYVHPVLRWTGPHFIFTWVVKKGIHHGIDPVAVEADRLMADFELGGSLELGGAAR